MARKRWTPQTEITDSLLRLREKRRWQLAYRRYVVEQKPSEQYAPYFGLDIATLRKWFELQFTGSFQWENYGKDWQFEHVLAANWFDFTQEQELNLCWNFINMRIQPVNAEPLQDLLFAKAYFEKLFSHTGYEICKALSDKIALLETATPGATAPMIHFVRTEQPRLTQLALLNATGFSQLNQGIPLKEVLLEMEILRKFS